MCPGKGASADVRVEKRAAAHCARDVTGRGTELEEKRVESNSVLSVTRVPDTELRITRPLISAKTLVPWTIVHRTLLTSGPENNFYGYFFGCQNLSRLLRPQK